MAATAAGQGYLIGPCATQDSASCDKSMLIQQFQDAAQMNVSTSSKVCTASFLSKYAGTFAVVHLCVS